MGRIFQALNGKVACSIARKAKLNGVQFGFFWIVLLTVHVYEGCLGLLLRIGNLDNRVTCGTWDLGLLGLPLRMGRFDDNVGIYFLGSIHPNSYFWISTPAENRQQKNVCSFFMM